MRHLPREKAKLQRSLLFFIITAAYMPIDQEPTMKIDFGQFVNALSDTIDLVGVDEIQHGKRVAYMALECAKDMGLDREEQLSLLRIGLLHDCGVSSTRVHKKLIDELDWADSSLHCQVGADRIRQFAPLADFADVILCHHSHWQELKELPLSNTAKRDANLIFLLDHQPSTTIADAWRERHAWWKIHGEPLAA